MILVASQRSGATALADHLSKTRDNDHVEILELDGFMADELHGAFQEVQAIAQVTRCKQYLFSLSLNPPPDMVASDQDFIDAADKVGKALGLDGQARAIVIHEKEGRRHAHAVWSRIDPETITAKHLPHFKTKLMSVAKELYLDHGWELPLGLQAHGGKNPLNFTLAEWQQAKRQGIDPREIKQTFRQAWEQSDSLIGLKNALEERGYFLAKGDRRGIVAVDVQGEVYSLARYAGVKAKDIRAKCGNGDDLDSVTTVKQDLRRKMTTQLRGFIDKFKAKHANDMAPLLDERDQLVANHRAERQQMKRKQTEREAQEQKTRIDRLNNGLRGLWDRVMGSHARVRNQNICDAMACAKRDQAQRDRMVEAQMRERQALQQRITALRQQQAVDRKIMARDIATFMTQKETRKNNFSRGYHNSMYRFQR